MNRAWALTAAGVAVAGEGVAIAASAPGAARWNEAAVAAAVVAYAAVGVLILWHRPGHPIGRIAGLIAPVWGVGEALVALAYHQLHVDPGDRAAAWASTIGTGLRGLPWLVAVLWLPLRFPDGDRPADRLGRIAARFSLTTIGCFLAASLFSPTLADTRLERIDNPLAAPGALGSAAEALAGLSLLLGAATIGLAVAEVVRRYRRGGPLTRQQTLVFAAAFVPPVAALVASFWDAGAPWLFGLVSVPLPLALGVAVLQRRLYDLPLAVNRSLTYGVLWVAIAALYALVVGGVGASVNSRHASWLPWLAAGVVAVSFAPLRSALQAGANRLVYGQWSQPTEVLAMTARRLDDASDVPALLGGLVDDVGSSLRLPHVRIVSTSGQVLASRGEATTDVDELPMTAYGVPVGVLAWSRRPLRESDLALLGDLARQLGAVVHATGLLQSVTLARERLVVAREEERRRLRRELHDGLGPALAGLTLHVDTVRNRLGAAADADLLPLRDGIQATVVDVRRIVEGLRPAAVDDLGLVPAVLALLAGLVGPGVVADVEAASLPALGAGTEVAAYRIVQEAVGNAIRHARPTRIGVRLGVEEDQLVVEVCDDGTGVVAPRADGVGLGSMQGRAEEIGGRFEIRATPGRGTTVAALLPVGGPR